MASSRADRICTLLVALALLSPYLIWWTTPGPWRAPDDLFALLAPALAQAFGTLALSFVGGFILFRALRALPPHQRGRGELRVLVPNAVPPLVLGLGLMGLVTPWGLFPFGLPAVVFAHALVDSGLVAVAFDRLARARLGQLTEAAWVMGLGERAFWMRVAWPLVRREVLGLALFVFALALSSFSLALLLGGGRRASLEIAVYDLVARGRWDQAVPLALVPAALLFAFAWGWPRPAAVARASDARDLPFRPRPAWGLLTWVPALVVGLGWAGGLAGLASWPETAGLLDAWLATASVGALTGAFTLFSLVVIAAFDAEAGPARFVLRYLPPSPVVVAFAVLRLGPRGELAQLASLAATLSFVSFAPLYRWQVHGALGGLAGQRAVARTLGAGRVRILRDVTWPQVAPAVLAATGLAAAWACGDFALSGLMLDHELTLPQRIVSSLARYRFGEAEVLALPLAATALGFFALYRRLGVAR